MAYTINKFNGAVLAVVADGTIDTTATNIKLVGKNYTGYGEILNENYVWMLENFASASAPTAPLVGQLWWNTNLGTLTVYDGTQFKAVSSSTVSATAPTGAVEGDLWWDSDDEQLYVYNGTAFVLIGPAFSSGAGQSGAIVEVIQDTGLSDHVVVKTFVSDVVIAITSKDPTFTPNIAITDFGDIKPGVNLVDDAGAVPGARFWGVAEQADTLDGIAATQFLRSDIATTALGVVNVKTDSGMTVGFTAATGQLVIDIAALAAVQMINQGLGGNLILGATNAGGTPVTGIDFDPDGLAVSVNGNSIEDVNSPSLGTDATNKTYVDAATGLANGGSLFADGSVLIAGTLIPDGFETRDFGSAGAPFDNIHAATFVGTATEALYADMAERFEADCEMAPGTVVALGGEKEITKASDRLSNNVFGVISTKPAHLMNSRAGTNETHPPVAMAGRVPVRVTGQVRKGDRLVSAGNGLAMAATVEELTAWNVIGRSLEDKHTEGTGVIEAIVSMKS